MATTKPAQNPWPRGQQPPWKIWSIANRCPGNNYLQTTALSSRASETLSPGVTVLKAVVLYDFKKSSTREITVKAKEEVLIIKNTNADWWYILHPLSGEKGYVPATYLEMIGTMIWSGACPPKPIAGQPTGSSRKRTSLLDLPYEIRCIVYEYVFLNNPIPFGPAPKLETLNLGLPFSSKLLYTESLYCYYNLSSFDGRVWKICLNWYIVLPEHTRTFVDNMRVRLQSLIDFETRQSLKHSTIQVLRDEGTPVCPIILNMILNSSSQNPKILPRHILSSPHKRSCVSPQSRWTLSSSSSSSDGWVRCKKALAKLKNGRRVYVVCDRICCMPVWMIEARKMVELCLKQRKGNEKFRMWKGEVLVELKEKFVRALERGRAGEEVVEVEGIWVIRRQRNQGAEFLCTRQDRQGD